MRQSAAHRRGLLQRPAKAVHLTLGFPAAQDCVSGG